MYCSSFSSGNFEGYRHDTSNAVTGCQQSSKNITHVGHSAGNCKQQLHTQWPAPCTEAVTDTQKEVLLDSHKVPKGVLKKGGKKKPQICVGCLGSLHELEQAWASAHACHDFNAQGEAASEAKLPRSQISAHAAIGHSHARFAMHSQNKPKHTARAAWQILLLLLGNVDT